MFFVSSPRPLWTKTNGSVRSQVSKLDPRRWRPSRDNERPAVRRRRWIVAQAFGPLNSAFEAAVLNTPLDSPPSPDTTPIAATPVSRGLSAARVRRLLSTTWRLAAPFWRHDAMAVWHGIACAFLHVLDSSLGAVFTDISGNLFTALNERNTGAFTRGSVTVFALCVLVVPISAFTQFIRSTLVLRWQQFLSKRGLRLYFEEGNYYRLANLASGNGASFNGESVDNPDEVLHEQFARFARNMVDIAMSNLRTVVEVVLYSVMLLKIFPPMYFFILAIVATGTLLINSIGRRLVDLQAQLLRRTANFRFALARIRIHAEAIAFYNGSNFEKANAERKLDARASTILELCKIRFPVDMFTNSFYFLPVVLPLLVLGPLYFAGRLQLGQLTKASTAFSVLFQNLSIFIGDYDEYASLGASIERLSRFVSTLEEVKPFADREFKILPTSSDGESAVEYADGKLSTTPGISIVEDPDENGLQLVRVSVDTPGGDRRVVDDVNLTVRPREKLLIVGRSGRGKTSLLRAIAGLWRAGSGKITRPPRERVFFMPQRPYCVQGSLRSQLLYPSLTIRDDRILERALDDVDLPDLCERVGGLDAEEDWAEYLSVGETQRLAFARLVLAQPDLVLIDEGTSAVDPVTEGKLMRILERLGCTVVSVGHRPSLVASHDVVLHLKENHRVELVAADEFTYPLA